MTTDAKVMRSIFLLEGPMMTYLLACVVAGRVLGLSASDFTQYGFARGAAVTVLGPLAFFGWAMTWTGIFDRWDY